MNELYIMTIMQCLTQSSYITKSKGRKSLFLDKSQTPKFAMSFRLPHRSLA